MKQNATISIILISITGLVLSSVLDVKAQTSANWQNWQCDNGFTFEVNPSFQKDGKPWSATRRIRVENQELEFQLGHGGDNDHYTSGSYSLVFWRNVSFYKQVGGQRKPLGYNCQTVATSPKVLAPDRFRIGGISPGMTEAYVRLRLGKPLQRTFSQLSCEGGSSVSLVYQNTRIELGSKNPQTLPTVNLIETSNPQLPTVDGVRVGDSQQKVLQTYGSPSQEERSPHPANLPRMVYFAHQDGSAFMSFTLRDNQVFKITYYTAIC